LKPLSGNHPAWLVEMAKSIPDFEIHENFFEINEDDLLHPAAVEDFHELKKELEKQQERKVMEAKVAAKERVKEIYVSLGSFFLGHPIFVLYSISEQKVNISSGFVRPPAIK
jgi:hypothetical protein